MYKLLLLSFLIATVAIPVVAARDASPRRGLKKSLALLAAFAVLYLLALLWIYPKLFYPSP